jgi:hypothetical protein
MHSAGATVTGNTCTFVPTFLVHQPNQFYARALTIDGNTAVGCIRFYATFDGSLEIDGVVITGNTIKAVVTAHDLPIIDLYNAISTTVQRDIVVANNTCSWYIDTTSIAGRSSPFLKAKSARNLHISGNIVRSSPGMCIHVIALIQTDGLSIHENTFVAFGSGAVAGNKVAVVIDNTTAISGVSSFVDRNRFIAGGVAPDGAVQVVGSLNGSIIDNILVGFSPLVYGSLPSGFGRVTSIVAHKMTASRGDGASANEALYSEKTAPSGEAVSDVDGVALLIRNDAVATNITNLTGGVSGQRVIIHVLTGNTTVVSGSGITLNAGGSYNITIYRNIMLMYSDTLGGWLEVNRS